MYYHVLKDDECNEARKTLMASTTWTDRVFHKQIASAYITSTVKSCRMIIFSSELEVAHYDFIQTCCGIAFIKECSSLRVDLLGAVKGFGDDILGACVKHAVSVGKILTLRAIPSAVDFYIDAGTMSYSFGKHCKPLTHNETSIMWYAPESHPMYRHYVCSLSITHHYYYYNKLTRCATRESTWAQYKKLFNENFVELLKARHTVTTYLNRNTFPTILIRQHKLINTHH
tara:strand:- start:349 stop:1035 length:687 start_codon:yes stop_codon:yes gene_type:complete